MTLKPCIQCGTECEILPVQLGDIFTLTYIRICSAECMFMLAYEYLYEIGRNKDFRSSLWHKQDPEDERFRNGFVESLTNEALENMREHMEETKHILPMPIPESILRTFEGVPPIPHCSDMRMNFARPTKQEKIRWQTEHVERLKCSLKEAFRDLERLENE